LSLSPEHLSLNPPARSDREMSLPSDLDLTWGGDLGLTPQGDLALAQGTRLSTERVLRRLLTNPGDYIWQTSYGAGLGRFVGAPAAPARISATIQSALRAEASVARTPPPTVQVSAAGVSAYAVEITYTAASPAPTPLTLSFTLPALPSPSSPSPSSL
jgi:hypothetical protein